MKKFIIIVILLGIFFKATAQNKAIDTVWFRVPNVTIVDSGLLDALDSIIYAYTQDVSASKLVWYVMFFDEEVDGNSGSKVEFYLSPSDVILPAMKKSDGFFLYKKNLFFIEKRNEKSKKNDHIFAYSNKTRPFYYITINWDLLWASDLEESKKARLGYIYASIQDYNGVFLTRGSDGLWTWRYNVL